MHFITPEEVGFISFLISFCLLHPFLLRPALIPSTEAKCPDLSYPAGHKKRSFVSLLYSSAIGGGDYSSEWLLCPSPIPMAPSLTTNFLLLRTLSIRYPNPPIFYRMATPPILAAAPRNLGTVYKPLADSKGDEDHSSAMLILSWPNEDVVRIRLFGPGPANSGGIRRH